MHIPIPFNNNFPMVGDIAVCDSFLLQFIMESMFTQNSKSLIFFCYEQKNNRT